MMGDIEEKREEVRKVINKARDKFNQLFDVMFNEVDNFDEITLKNLLEDADEFLEEIDKDIKDMKRKLKIEPVDITKEWVSEEKSREFAD